MKKNILYAACGLLIGFIYGISMGCGQSGRINCMLLFSMLGLLYGNLAKLVDLLTRKFLTKKLYGLVTLIIRPFAKALIIWIAFPGLLILFDILFGLWGSSLRAIFQYGAICGLGLFWSEVFFLFCLGGLVFIINFAAELYRICKNKPNNS